MPVSEEANNSTDLMNLGEARVLTAADVLRHAKLIEEVKSAVMKPETHYGLIPGCGPKPALLKPGAEKLLLTFGLSTQHDIQQRDLGGGHREYEVRTIVKSGQRIIAEGVGVCSTMEKKYRYRAGARKCPTCSKERTLIQTKGGRNPGGYWCVPDKGGCGGNFQPGDKAVEGQVVGQVENPDLADTYNTVLKMAKKRSLVDGALTSTASSDFFAQDLEDLEVKDAQFIVQEAAAAAAAPPPAAESTPPPRRRASAPKATQAPPQDVEFLGGKGASETGAMLEQMTQEPAARAAPPPEPPAEPPPAPAASSPIHPNGEPLRSMRGLTLEEWKLLTEEQRAASKDVTRKQCVLISSLAKSKGINDLALIMGELRNDFTREFDEFGIKELWQVDQRIASYAIDQLKATPF
jgi:hypothetical protein